MMPFIIKHKWRLGFIAIIFVVVTVVGFMYFYAQLRSRSKAAPTGSAILSLDPVSNPPMGTDGVLKVAVNLDPNGATTPLYSFDVQFKFNPAKVEFATAGGVANNINWSGDVLPVQVVLIGTDTIRLVGSKINNPFTSSNKLIGSISFKMKSSSDFPVSFTWGAVALETVNFVKIPLELATNAVTSSSSSSSSQNPDVVSLYFSTSQTQYHIGDNVNLDLYVATGAKQIGSVRAGIMFDPTILEYKTTSGDTSVVDKSATVPPPAGGSFISVDTSLKHAFSGSLKIATLTFAAKAKGTVNFVYVQDKSAVLSSETNPQNILTIVIPYAITVNTISGSSSSSSSSSISTGTVEQPEGHLLHINSNASYPSPFRYEQTVSLESGDYTLSGLAKVYTRRGRGVTIIISCGEADCNYNGLKQGGILVRLPFAASSSFVRQEVGFKIQNGAKKYIVRIYVDDGSEADFDYISIKNVWDGELVENGHFEKKSGKTFSRKYPDGWDADAGGILYGGLYNQKETDTGTLYINSSARQ